MNLPLKEFLWSNFSPKVQTNNFVISKFFVPRRKKYSYILLARKEKFWKSVIQ